LYGDFPASFSDVHVQSFCEEVGRKGVFYFWVFDGNIGKERFFAENVEEVSSVPDIFVGQIFCQVAISISHWQYIKCKFLVLPGWHLPQKVSDFVEN
jgi:hypothetical protein